MVLVDTSVWVDHFPKRERSFAWSPCFWPCGLPSDYHRWVGLWPSQKPIRNPLIITNSFPRCFGKVWRSVTLYRKASDYGARYWIHWCATSGFFDDVRHSFVDKRQGLARGSPEIECIVSFLTAPLIPGKILLDLELMALPGLKILQMAPQVENQFLTAWTDTDVTLTSSRFWILFDSPFFSKMTIVKILSLFLVFLRLWNSSVLPLVCEFANDFPSALLFNPFSHWNVLFWETLLS